MQNSDAAMGNLILVANHHFQNARWWQIACAWIFGRHQTVRHIGRVGRVSFWRGKPYLLSFRETA